MPFITYVNRSVRESAARVAARNARLPKPRRFVTSESLTFRHSEAQWQGAETGRGGKRGSFVTPAALRRRYGLDEGALVIAEERPDGILLRPAVAMTTESYTPERKAAFLLENAVGAGDYQAACEAVRAMGLDPARIAHSPPRRKRKTRTG